MLDKIKRSLLSKMVSEIESFATSRSKWGSNIETAFCTISIIHRNKELLNDQMFIAVNRQKEVKAAFRDMIEIVSWLEGVRNLHNYFSQNSSVRGLPEEAQRLVLAEGNSIRLTRLLSSHGDLKDISEYVDIAHKYLSEIYQAYPTLPEVVRQNLERKLQNGYNTVLVINELILEVMINVQ